MVHFVVPSPAKKIVLQQALMDKDNTKFLEENFQKILNLFSPEKQGETLKEIKKLKVIRSNRMFPKKKNGFNNSSRCDSDPARQERTGC
ncbi:hypothetical protein LJC47_00645 [Desulfosarcina sp. OttesenSCG-928-B08]|nr:hypothetical protein [Desulfosarcina sp. OttesenSCG-928-B08]